MKIITKNLTLNLDDISFMVLDPDAKSALVSLHNGNSFCLTGPALADLQQAIEKHDSHPTLDAAASDPSAPKTEPAAPSSQKYDPPEQNSTTETPLPSARLHPSPRRPLPLPTGKDPHPPQTPPP